MLRRWQASDHVAERVIAGLDAVAHRAQSRLWKNAWPPQYQTSTKAALRLAASIFSMQASASAGS